jgi:hypothetical protein
VFGGFEFDRGFDFAWLYIASKVVSNPRSNSKPPNTGAPWTHENIYNISDFRSYIQPREVEPSIKLKTTKHRTAPGTHENIYKISDHFGSYIQPREVEPSIKLKTTKRTDRPRDPLKHIQKSRPLWKLYTATRSRTLDQTQNHQTQDRPVDPRKHIQHFRPL